ncbi:MAG: MFS transporter [Chloroflexi bacterium]|nr:MFS transporter [Chloroflexota bacterium]
MARGLMPHARWFYAFFPNNLANGCTQSLTALFITQVLGGNVATVGQVAALTSLAAAPSSIFWGRLSDRTRRHKDFIILGFLGFGVPTLLMGLSEGLVQFYILSVILGFLAMASSPAATTLLMERFPRGEWAEQFGRFNQVGGWGLLFGRLLGFLWLLFLTAPLGSPLSMRTLFMVCGLLSVVSAILARQLIQEPKRHREGEEVPRSLWQRLIPPVERIRYLPVMVYNLFLPRSLYSFRIATRGPLGLYFLATAFLFFGFLVAYTPFPIFLVESLGASNEQVFGLGVLNALASTLSYGYMGRQTRRLGNRLVQGLAALSRVFIFALFGVVGIFLAGGVGLVAIAVLHTLAGVAWAAIATAGVAAVAELSPKNWSGRAMGIYNAVIIVAAIVGSLLGGEMALRLGYPLTFFVSSAAVALGAVLLIPLPGGEIATTPQP